MRRIFTLVALLSLFAAGAQDQQINQPDTTLPVEFERQFYIYSLAKKYNDVNTSINALYNMLSIYPNNQAVMDSLAKTYYEYNKYFSAALLSRDIVQLNPSDKLAMEIAALSFDNVGLKDQAVDFYEKMYLEDNNIGVLYRMAFLQYELKRFAEASTSIEIMLESEEAAKQEVYFPINDKENQAVNLKAAVHRLKGMVLEAQGQIEEAKKSYLNALEVQGDFVLAQKQLSELTKK